MTPEMYQIEEQKDRETKQDQQAEEWGFAMLELAELVKRWGYDAVLKEVKRIEPPEVTSRNADIMFRAYYEES